LLRVLLGRWRGVVLRPRGEGQGQQKGSNRDGEARQHFLLF
jgi:hypothetical protein